MYNDTSACGRAASLSESESPNNPSEANDLGALPPKSKSLHTIAEFRARAFFFLNLGVKIVEVDFLNKSFLLLKCKVQLLNFDIIKGHREDFC